MKTVIINADDLGMAVSTNEAIAIAHREGILTSASLMATTPAWEHALTSVVNQYPDLGIGIHLSLTSGQAVSTPASIRLLVDSTGRFRRGISGLCRLLAGKEREPALAQIEREFRAQFDKLAGAGVQPDHANGHQHVHMIPAVWTCFVRLATEYGVHAIRMTDEPFDLGSRSLVGWIRSSFRLNPVKRMLLSTWARRNRHALTAMSQQRPVPRCTDWFAGVLDSGCMDATTLCRILARKRSGVGEIALHPGLVGNGCERPETGNRQSPSTLSGQDQHFVRAPARFVETQALLAPTAQAQIDASGITRETFRSAFARESAVV